MKKHRKRGDLKLNKLRIADLNNSNEIMGGITPDGKKADDSRYWTRCKGNDNGQQFIDRTKVLGPYDKKDWQTQKPWQQHKAVH